MNRIFQRHSFVAVSFLLGLIFFAGAMSVKAVTLYGVSTSNQLVQFDSASPGTFTVVGTITGLQTGETIAAIDSRPATGELFALGTSSRLYIINPTTGVATAVGGQFSTLLSGTEFGFDFNPTVDLIRVVSNTGQNLRINPNTGAVTVDTPLNPPTTGVTYAAYTNNSGGFGLPNTTTLYVIDANTDTLYIQNPANSGTLTAVGPLGADFQLIGEFDIVSTQGGTNTAYAVTTSADGSSSLLYTINLTTGAATLTATIPTPLRGLAAQIPRATAALNLLDFNGDRRADFAVFRPSNGFVYIARSPGNPSTSFTGFPFGVAGDDIFAPGDYDGDGRTDLAVFRNSTGTFYVMNSSNNTVTNFQFGLPGDEPVARDYDGDGKTDFAVARRANGMLTFYVRNSSNGTIRTEQFGVASDVVAPGDYDGDGKFDFGVFRGSGPNGSGQATFYVRLNTGGFIAAQFGLGSDLVVPGDYDGDGKTDFAVVRQGTPYTWYVLQSSTNTAFGVQFGQKPDLPVQNDYDGDGKTDIAVYRPQTSSFYVLRSSDNGVTSAQFGINGDYPIANYDTH